MNLATPLATDSILHNITTQPLMNSSHSDNLTLTLTLTMAPSVAPFQYHLSPAHIVQLVLCSLLLLIGLIANSVVIIIYLATPSLKNPTNYYLMNLMLVDLVILCFNIPVVIISEIMQDNRHYTMGDTMCKLSQSIAAASVYIMSFILVAISLDRYMAVKYPLKSRLNNFWTACVIVVLWVFAFALVIPELMYLKVLRLTKTSSVCTRIWPDTNRYRITQNYMIYMICITCIGFIIPLIIMICTNIQITVIVKRSGSIFGGETHSQSLDKTKRHVLVMVITIVVVYILCLTPKEAVRLLSACQLIALPYDQVKILVVVVRYIAYANAAINPIIYAMLNKQFKARLYRILRWPMTPYDKFNSSVARRTSNQSITITRSSRKTKNSFRYSLRKNSHHKSSTHRKSSAFTNGHHVSRQPSSSATSTTEVVYLSPSEIDIKGLIISPTADYL